MNGIRSLRSHFGLRQRADVAAIGVLALATRLEARPVAPGAIVPIELRAAVAARAAGRERRFVAEHFAAVAAPGAGLHGFGDGPVAAAAFEVRFQLPAELPQELLLADFFPMRASWCGFVFFVAGALRA